MLTSRVNDDLMEDLGTLLKNRQEFVEYAEKLRTKLGDDDESVPPAPAISSIRFGQHDGRTDLMDRYVKHRARETQPRNDDGSLTQLRDWERTGADDLTLIESLVTKNDPELNQAGHDYQ